MTPERFSAVLELIHRAPLQPDLWPQAMTAITDALGSSISALVVRDMRTGFVPLAATDERTPFEGMEAYRDHYAAIDTLAAAAQQRAEGEVVTSEMLLSRDRLGRSEVWNDFYVPWKLDRSIGAAIGKEDGLAASIVVYRTRNQDEFGSDDFRVMGMIVPHVTLALRCWLRIRDSEARSIAGTEALDTLAAGVILLERSGRVTWMNRSARDLIAASDALSYDRGELVGSTQRDTAHLRRAVQSAHASDASWHKHVLLQKKSGGEPLPVFAMPLFPDMAGQSPAAQSADVMLVLSPRQSEAGAVGEWLRCAWHLTPAEASLACEIAHGRSLLEISAERGVTVETLRSHLKRILQKTGLHTQAQLVRLVLTSPAAVVHS